MFKQAVLATTALILLSGCSDPVSDQIESWLKTRPEFTEHGYKIKEVDGRDGFYYAAIQLSPEEVASYKTLYALAKASNDYWTHSQALEANISKNVKHLCPPKAADSPEGKAFWQQMGEISFFDINPSLPDQLPNFGGAECTRE